MRNFIAGSNTFEGFTFNGCYTMNRQDFFRMYEYFQQTEINLLDDYSRMIHMEWDEKCPDVQAGMYAANADIYYESINLLCESGIFKSEWLDKMNGYINGMKRKYERYLELKRNRPRIEANLIIRDVNVRRAVFELHGKKCLCCGSGQNITMDHVIPITKGGSNEIDNMQPLCKSCNSRKGTKIIDYRLEACNG